MMNYLLVHHDLTLMKFVVETWRCPLLVDGEMSAFNREPLVVCVFTADVAHAGITVCLDAAVSETTRTSERATLQRMRIKQLIPRARIRRVERVCHGLVRRVTGVLCCDARAAGRAGRATAA